MKAGMPAHPDFFLSSPNLRVSPGEVHMRRREIPVEAAPVSPSQAQSLVFVQLCREVREPWKGDRELCCNFSCPYQ
jgi:hypothetical protein